MLTVKCGAAWRQFTFCVYKCTITDEQEDAELQRVTPLLNSIIKYLEKVGHPYDICYIFYVIASLTVLHHL